MKTNKFFMAATLVATLAMIGCNKEKNPPIIEPNPGTEEIECPDVAAPAAGKTTMVIYAPENTTANGIYAVGTVNEWKETDTETCKFTKVGCDETGRWYQLTMDYAADMGVKVCAVPSKPERAGWSYQWGKNIDPNDPDTTIKADNVILLKGDLEFVYENQGQPKATKLADGGVVYIQVKAWAADPNIKEQPATAIAFKHPWNGGEWGYRDAVSKGNNVFELAARYGNNGFNVKDENGAEAWYPTTGITIYDGAATGDSVLVRFTSRAGSAEGDLEVVLIEKGVVETPDPVIVTVRAKYPAEWTETPTAWVWPTGGDGGAEVTLEKDGDFYKYTTPEAVPGLNIIFKNGAGWTGDANQTENIEGILADTDYIITYNEGKKATVEVVKK